MKATAIFFEPPTTDQERPTLTPELNAAVAARHSRTPEGLESILEKISGMSKDKAVDTIFRYADYGHASIHDMIPVSIHLEGVSSFLAMMLWSLVKVGGGQEQSTRYNTLGKDSFLGGNTPHTEQCVSFFEASKGMWEELAKTPTGIEMIGEHEDEKKLDRLRRNFVFDRARSFYPMTSLTNMNITTWGREMARICALLEASPWEEFHEASQLLRAELNLCCPRLVRHSYKSPVLEEYWKDVLHSMRSVARATPYSSDFSVHTTLQYLKVFDLKSSKNLNRENRYHPSDMCRRLTPVFYGWSGVSIAELRDMNRHRPGERDINLAPYGFYCAQDQFAAFDVPPAQYDQMYAFGDEVSRQAHAKLLAGEAGFVYDLMFGSTVSFLHTSTLNNLIYEVELRTGPGTHYRYREHYLDLLKVMQSEIQDLGPILTGSGEPE